MINRARVRPLNEARPGPGPVVYWMSRDQRVRDNWALLYAQELALSLGQPLGVVFCLAPAFLGATLRQYGFMLKGLEEVAGDLADLNLPFFLLTGEPARELPGFVAHHRVGAVVSDFSPLRLVRGWKTAVAARHQGFPGGSGRAQRGAVLGGLPQGGIRRLYFEAQA